MTKLKLTKIFAGGLALIITTCPQAWSQSFPVKNCIDSSGLKCWHCGNDCTATLYSNGKLVFSGTGTVYDPGKGGLYVFAPGSPGLPIPIVSVEFTEGITSLQEDTLWGASTVREIIIPDSLQYVGWDAFGTGSTVKLIMSDESKLNSVDVRQSGLIVNEIACKGNLEKCQNTAQGFFHNATFDYYKEYDEDDNLILEYHDNGYYSYNGKIISKYDKEGTFIESNSYDGGGNIIASYDSKGNLTYKRTSYTPTEALAAANRGNNNTITLTFK